MDLALQCGAGMMGLNCALIERWGMGTVILSPRDLNPAQLLTHAKSIRGLGGEVLLDPQFYLPRADHHRLVSHDFWPPQYDTGVFWTGAGLRDLIAKLVLLNTALESRVFIVPGLLCSEVTTDWLAFQRAVLDEASRAGIDKPVYSTIALAAEVANDPNQIHAILDEAATWPAQGYYVACKHPNDEYLVESPTWLANNLDLVAGLRLRGAEVIVGYSTHQLLSAAVAHTNAIASGTWLNVRIFGPEKFEMQEEQERRKATWYYAPTALSEFKLPFLDVAFEAGLITSLAADVDMRPTDADRLFQGVRPSTVGLSLSPDAFRHYLHCLRVQALRAVKPTFDETLDAQNRLLDEAEALLDRLHAAGVKGQQRDFSDIIDVNRAALSLFQARRGAMMRRRWSAL